MGAYVPAKIAPRAPLGPSSRLHSCLMDVTFKGSVFEPALDRMREQGSDSFGPTSFQGYIAKHGLPRARTWQAISVDSVSRLAPALRAEGVMVFRLGCSAEGRHTQFGLMRRKSSWGDFFMLDEVVFGSVPPEVFLPSVQSRELFAFQLLPTLTETSVVNLALASGLLAHALGIDRERSALVPATGQSTFSFDVRPREDLSAVWRHQNGQVEIDALFVAERKGEPHLFVVEAKFSNSFDSLAKHKLAYPLLALATVVPSYLPIVPVYLRVMPSPDGLHFCVCECAQNAQAGPLPSVDSLRPQQVRRLVLAGMGRRIRSAS